MEAHDAVARTSEQEASNKAVDAARRALDDPERAARYLAEYYTVPSDYAGATFLAIPDEDPHRFTAADVAAVQLLNVKLTPQGVRNLLQGPGAESCAQLLHELPVDARLSPSLPETQRRAMLSLHQQLKAMLGRNPWVTAAKLTARKRPGLFPVRDRVVVKYLGLPDSADAQWSAFAQIIVDPEVVERLQQALAMAQRQPGVDIGDPTQLLRHLDVVLWRHAKAGGA